MWGCVGGGREQAFLGLRNRRVRAQKVAPCGHEEERDKPGQPECPRSWDAGESGLYALDNKAAAKEFFSRKGYMSIHSESFKDVEEWGRGEKNCF